MTPSQLEFYEHLKEEYGKFKLFTNSFPHLAHLKTPADRYKHFCDAGNRKRSQIPDVEPFENIFKAS